MVSWEYPPLVVGGLGRHVHQLCTELARLGHDVHVVTRGRAPDAATELVEGVTVHRAATDAIDIDLAGESVLAWVQAFEHSLTRAALTALANWTPDVIHAHDWLVAQTAHTVHQVTRAPVVATIHATEYGRQQGWLGNSVPRAIHSVERWLTHNAASVIVCSRFMAAQVSELFDVADRDITVIATGIAAAPAPTGAAITAARRRYGGEGPLIAFAGRLVHEKGVQELIKALPLLHREHPGLRAVIAGTGPLADAQQDRAERYGVADLVSWPGFLDADELAVLLAAADVVVVPSLYEPFGMVVLEAQLAGTPVAVSATGGLTELVEAGRTGAVFEPESPTAIAAAVGGLLANPIEARAMARRARQIATDDFSWQAIARRTVAVYRDVASDQGLPGRTVQPTR